MSTSYKMIIFLMVLVLNLAFAFNSDRLEHKEEHEHEHNRHHVKRHAQDANEIRIKRRHLRPRQVSEEVVDEDILKIFGLPESQKQKRQVPFYSAPYPQYSQSTVVPNGNQINNFYPQFLPFSTGGVPFPIFVPILICLNPQNQGPNITDRFSFPDDPEVIANNAANAANQNNNNNNNNNNVPIRRPVYNPIIIDTPTGISLEPVRPSRPNSRPPPPLVHSSNTQGSSSSNVPSNQLRPLNRPSTPAQNRPSPPVQSQQYPQSINNIDSSLQGQASQRPDVTPCLYATIMCCTQNFDTNRLATCFRENRCPGPFWDVHPCDTDFGRIATRTATRNSFV